MPTAKNGTNNVPVLNSNNTNSQKKEKRKTPAEMREFQKQQHRKELYEKIKETMTLLDLTKTYTKSYTIYNKENLRTYMKNPTSNEDKIRQLSRFLYRVSQPYRRLVNYNAQLMDLTAMTIIPIVDFTQDNSSNKESILKDYYDTCVEVDKMRMFSEVYKLLITAWIEDAAYGYIYEDDNGFFIYPLDGTYCKVSSINEDGTLNFAYDFSYFRSRQELLEYWDSEFQSKYNQYQSNTSTMRWQQLEPEKTICIKIGIDDPTLCLPPYIGLFEAIIDNVDLQSIAAVKDELSIYKLLVARMEHMDGSDDPDDFEVNPDVALDYYNKLIDALPPEVSAVLSPVPIEPIEFKGTTTEDTDMVANSMSNLFKISGGSMILNDEKSGTTIYRAHMIADAMNALKPLLGQIETWVNRHLSYNLNNPSKVKYMETTPWLKNEKRKEIIESAQYGVPVKMALGALDGFSPLQILSMQFLENDILGLHEQWIPLQSSYTQSGDSEGGGQEKDVTELGDEGASTREDGKNDM